MSSKSLPITDDQMSNMVFIKNDNDEKDVATFIINTDNWLQPDTEEEIIKLTSYIANVATNTLLKSQKRGFEKFDVIVYLENFKVKQLNYKFVKYLADILKALFPERLRKATIVDPPRFFISGYDVIKKFLDKPTRQKLKLISTKENKQVYFDNVDD